MLAYLIEENRVRRRQMGGRRLRLTMTTGGDSPHGPTCCPQIFATLVRTGLTLPVARDGTRDEDRRESERPPRGGPGKSDGRSTPGAMSGPSGMPGPRACVWAPAIVMRDPEVSRAYAEYGSRIVHAARA